MNIFGVLEDGILGPERIFVVRGVEEPDYSDYSFGKVRGSIGAGLSGTLYSREIPIRRFIIELGIDGEDYRIGTRVPLESIDTRESFDGILPRDLDKIRKLVGKKIVMRSIKPYNSRTIRKLARKR